MLRPNTSFVPGIGVQGQLLMVCRERKCIAQEEAEAGAEGGPALMDPITDLKLNQLDIVEAVRERQSLLQVLPHAGCQGNQDACAIV